jgi:hypothetical protein
MTTTTTARLTAAQAATVERARKVLGGGEPPSMYELGDRAVRIGALEWYLGELLALVGQLAGAE